jgi:2-iminobutanoate/2-iminopropanoate deaminase
MRRLTLVLLVLLLAFAALTFWALEAGDVAVLVTQRPEGSVRETHVWWAEDDGTLQVEAATPERAWLAEALEAGEIEVERDGRRERFRVERSDAPGAHDRVRALLRAKYGWRDAWVGVLQDTSRSVAVRLSPLPRVVFDRSPETEAADLPFSDAVRVGDLLFLSGQLGIRPGERQLVPGGIEAEAAQILDNIRAVLERNGSSLEQVVKCTAFLADMSEWPRMNAVYRRYFPKALPARSAFGAAGLAYGARLELECIATVQHP